MRTFAPSRRCEPGGATPEVREATLRGAAVNRWEWRTFGVGDDVFGARTPHRVEEGDEVYILSVARGDTVKVRDGLMDVKRLEGDRPSPACRFVLAARIRWRRSEPSAISFAPPAR